MNRARARYFDASGAEVSASRALDRDGTTLRSGFSIRTSMTARDAGPRGQAVGDLCTRNGWPGTTRRGADGELYCDIGRKDAKPRITDGYGNSGLALQRPGFRLSTDGARQKTVADSYRAYERSLVRAYLDQNLTQRMYGGRRRRRRERLRGV